MSKNTPSALPGAWEAAALGVLERLGCPHAPIDSLQIALQLGLRLAPTSVPTAMLAGNAVMLSPRLSAKAARWYAAHEIGHWVLGQAGLLNCEAGADRVAEALLLPQYAFEPDLFGWDVARIQRQHIHCSLETIARRIVSIRNACLTVHREGRTVTRVCSSLAPSLLGRATSFERLLGRAAAKLGGFVQAGSRVIGFVDDDDPSRVVTLCATDELLVRLGTPGLSPA